MNAQETVAILTSVVMVSTPWCWTLWIFTLKGYRAAEMGFRDGSWLAQLHRVSEGKMRTGTEVSGHEGFIEANARRVFVNQGMPRFLRTCSWNVGQPRNQSPWILIMPLLLSSLKFPWLSCLTFLGIGVFNWKVKGVHKMTFETPSYSISD